MEKQFSIILYAELRITRPIFPENRAVIKQNKRDNDLK